MCALNRLNKKKQNNFAVDYTDTGTISVKTNREIINEMVTNYIMTQKNEIGNAGLEYMGVNAKISLGHLDLKENITEL